MANLSQGTMTSRGLGAEEERLRNLKNGCGSGRELEKYIVLGASWGKCFRNRNQRPTGSHGANESCEIRTESSH